MNKDQKDALIVDQAFRDILQGNFDSDAVHEVMQRRAGTLLDYHRLQAERNTAITVTRHTGRGNRGINQGR